MVTNIFLLLVVPAIFTFFYLVCSNRFYYKILSGVFCILGTLFSVSLAINGPVKLLISGKACILAGNIITVLELFITAYIFYVSIKNKKWKVLSLAVISLASSVYLIFTAGEAKEVYLNIDKLSIVLALIVNIVGTLITLFANEYMKHYEEQRHIKSRQKLFYSAICIFISAMNGLIFSDSLSWVYFFWEITTLISFILISYNDDEEAINSGFKALFLNLIGGISFQAAMIVLVKTAGITRLSQIEQSGSKAALYIPVLLLCIAGFAKSAQFPFQSWLLGAMVAPTPVSALLHSSTMVNAGVYLIVKLSPAYAGGRLGTAIAIYGGFSFFICSIIAFTQKNAKRVLAYSTIANLGLIISSAGIGTSIAVSAAIMLIIFHAISKALLFLCTGQIEHVVGSRNIEDMTGLIRKAPGLTILCVFGILSMILPPFGVLITKWISIEASANNPFVTIFLILGSAFTSAYYIKWLGTLLSYPVNDLKPRYKMEFTTCFPLIVLGLGILLTSIFLARIFNIFVSPEVSGLLKSENQLFANRTSVYSKVGSFNGAIVFTVIIAALAIFFLIRKFLLSPDIKKVYLCGENDADSNGVLEFRSGNGGKEQAVVSNLYLYNTINEEKLTAFGYVFSVAMLLITFVGGLL